jgi:hypothetical protein
MFAWALALMIILPPGPLPPTPQLPAVAWPFPEDGGSITAEGDAAGTAYSIKGARCDDTVHVQVHIEVDAAGDDGFVAVESARCWGGFTDGFATCTRDAVGAFQCQHNWGRMSLRRDGAFHYDGQPNNAWYVDGVLTVAD